MRLAVVRALPVFGPLVLVLCALAPAQDKAKDGKGQANPDLPKELVPKLFTYQGKDLEVGKVLGELAKQTGNVVEDRRRTKEGGKGKGEVGSRNFTALRMTVPAPQRSANQIKVFKGKLSAIGPVEMIAVTFDKLDKIEKKEQARKETVKGVTVHLRELFPEQEGEEPIWRVGLLLEYPADGPKFESFQSFVVRNEIYFEKEKDGVL